MIGVNKVILVGRVDGAPETSTTKAGKTICTMRLRMIDQSKDGQRERLVEVATWGDLATKCQGLGIGEAVCVDGFISSNTYADKNGKTRYGMNVTAWTVQVLGGGAATPVPAPANNDVPW